MRRRKEKGIKFYIFEDPQPRNRWQALDLLIEVQEAMIANRPGKVCTLLEMDPSLFEELTMDELGHVLEIRITDLAKEAGVKLEMTE